MNIYPEANSWFTDFKTGERIFYFGKFNYERLSSSGVIINQRLDSHIYIKKRKVEKLRPGIDVTTLTADQLMTIIIQEPGLLLNISKTKRQSLDFNYKRAVGNELTGTRSFNLTFNGSNFIEIYTFEKI